MANNVTIRVCKQHRNKLSSLTHEFEPWQVCAAASLFRVYFTISYPLEDARTYGRPFPKLPTNFYPTSMKKKSGSRWGNRSECGRTSFGSRTVQRTLDSLREIAFLCVKSILFVLCEDFPFQKSTLSVYFACVSQRSVSRSVNAEQRLLDSRIFLNEICTKKQNSYSLKYICLIIF